MIPQEYMHRTLKALVNVLEKIVVMGDPYTAGHMSRVKDICALLSEELNVTDGKGMRWGIAVAASIHDIGKIFVPANILAKPGKLSEAECMILKEHPIKGYDLLKNIEFDWPIADIVLQHHERWDGTGYPNGLEGSAIMTEARILSIADVFEALVSHRPYRPAYSEEEAMNLIMNDKGYGFDPTVVGAMWNLYSAGKLDKYIAVPVPKEE